MAIDPKLFTVEGLLNVLLADHSDAYSWRHRAEIIVNGDHMPPRPRDLGGARLRCIVRLGSFGQVGFLRHSVGPRQGFFWDIYGDDMLSPALALLALAQAAPPPWLLIKEGRAAIDAASLLCACPVQYSPHERNNLCRPKEK